MCCCAAPNVNGTLGYQWQPTDKPAIRPVNPPKTDRVVLYDEPGRCGGQDSHCHHYRIVGGSSLLVRHGGGDEEIRLSNAQGVLAALALLESNGRYWLLNAIYHAYADGKREGQAGESARWRLAAAERRIKVRKIRGQGGDPCVDR
jgi:hypothetical protein